MVFVLMHWLTSRLINALEVLFTVRLFKPTNETLLLSILQFKKNICSYMCFMTSAGFIADFAESEQPTHAFVYVIIMSFCRDVVGIQISDDVTHKALFQSHK